MERKKSSSIHFTLISFVAEYLLAKSKSECSDMNTGTIVPIDTKEGCQRATSDLDAVNEEVLEEQSESQPLGCYMYTPRNELVFNMGDEKTGKGLPKDGWSDDTRKVCRDFEAAMSKSGGKDLGKYRADSSTLN